MACYNTDLVCANQRVYHRTGVTPYQHPATTTFIERMMAVVADNCIPCGMRLQHYEFFYIAESTVTNVT